MHAFLLSLTLPMTRTSDLCQVRLKSCYSLRSAIPSQKQPVWSLDSFAFDRFVFSCGAFSSEVWTFIREPLSILALPWADAMVWCQSQALSTKNNLFNVSKSCCFWIEKVWWVEEAMSQGWLAESKDALSATRLSRSVFVRTRFCSEVIVIVNEGQSWVVRAVAESVHSAHRATIHLTMSEKMH